MEKMDVDDVVDLSISSSGRDSVSLSNATVRDLRALTQNAGLTITPAPPSTVNNEPPYSRRVLRPRTEPKSYAEAPDIVLLPAKINGRQQNGNIDSDTDDEEMPPIIAIKELSAGEIWERDRGLRKLREELRNEETKLVLLKKLKQSQQVMKENLIVTHTNASNSSNPLVDIPAALSLSSKGSLSVTPAPPPSTSNLQITAHSKSNRNSSPLMRQPSSSSRASVNVIPQRSSLPGGATLTPGGPPSHRSSYGQSRTGSNLTITPSVTITPTSAPSASSKQRNQLNILESAGKLNQVSSSVSITPAPPHMSSNNDLSKNDRSSREDVQTPAQRQAAAKLALRKQLEKTLLQIPPPKPPPPEMNFIPNPSNTEFVYLLGLETVVDYLTKEKTVQAPVQQPFRCSQCKIDFTPLWKWEKQGKTVNATFQNAPVGKESKIICEQCVTTNVKKALKAEHTNRLKTAFVKALQQEQEIEQRLATQSSPSPTSHSSHSYTATPSVTATPVTITAHPAKPQTPTQRPTQRPTPPIPAKSATPSASESRQKYLAELTNERTQQQQQAQIQQLTNDRTLAEAEKERERRAQAQQQQQAQIQQLTNDRTQQQQAQQQQVQQQQAQIQQEAAAAQLNALASLAGFGLGGLGGLANLGSLNNLGNSQQAAQAAQAQLAMAFQQQLLRGLQGMSGNSASAAAAANAHLMNQFNPLYMYQLQMAAQLQGKKSSSKNNANASMQNAIDIQRFAELQRQYLLELASAQHQQQASSSSNRQNNWKP